jgi:hypothetical protein
MKAIAAGTLFVLALPMFGQAPASPDDIFEQVLDTVKAHLSAVNTPATATVTPRQYALANFTTGGNIVSVRRFANDHFDVATADILLAEYESVASSPREITRVSVDEIPVLPLSPFAIGPSAYDWARLNAKYPDVQAVIRVSAPAVVSDTYAIAWYEVITPSGPAWAAVEKFEKQGNGTWKPVAAHVGDLWSGHAPN